MKKIFVTSFTIVSSLLVAGAQSVSDRVIKNLRVDNSNHAVMDFVIDLTEVTPRSNHAVVITPRITDGEHSAELGAVGVYGRSRYYTLQREGDTMLSGCPDERAICVAERPDTIHLVLTTRFESWMNGADILLRRTEYGCCGNEEEVDSIDAGIFFDVDHYLPTLLYRQPVAIAEKHANMEGSANILFPVNDTRLSTTFANNKEEMSKIAAVIDSVKNDPDITLTGIRLKGYASPEGSYDTNRRLAANRTEAIRQYLLNLYNMDARAISCDSEPEDWAGVRTFLASTTLQGRDEILKIIDTVSNPDERDDRIRMEYPYAYKMLMELCYPVLRHTDYHVSYNIRSYSYMEEIKRVFAENPKKLSLNELYLLANTYAPGSAAYDKVFTTAVLLYPGDSIANLNAANVALTRHDLSTASQYLHHAGHSGEADYARGVLYVLRKNYNIARQYLTKAKDAGVGEAENVLNTIRIF